MKIHELNLTRELARLLYYTARVATSIRQRSEYAANDMYNGLLHGKDIWQLADTLHNFDMLGHAILANNPKTMLRVCDLLLDDYQRYADSGADASRHAEHDGHMVDLQEGIGIIADIKARIRPLMQRNRQLQPGLHDRSP